MRGTRWLLLVAIVAILGGIGAKYRAQMEQLRKSDQALSKPAPLPPNTDVSNQLQHFTETETKDGVARVRFEVWAKGMSEVKNSGRVDFNELKIRLPNKKDDADNIVQGAAASFFKSDHHFYSEGDVAITLNVPRDGQPERKPISIQSSGVNCDTVSGRVETDRHSSFAFEHGEGTATGAIYDPNIHQLLMKSDVKVDWIPAGPNARPMKIEGGSLEYHETEEEIWLKPWGRLTRENSETQEKTVVEGQDVVIRLEKDAEGHQVIHRVDATKAHGTDDNPTRKLAYSAGRLGMDFDDNGIAKAMSAQDDAKLVSTSDTAETTVTGDRVDLGFTVENKQSLLSAVTTTGHSVVTSKPIPSPGRALGETHVLRSDKFDMKMRPGGREYRNAWSPTRRAAWSSCRTCPPSTTACSTGNDMTIAYGAAEPHRIVPRPPTREP